MMADDQLPIKSLCPVPTLIRVAKKKNHFTTKEYNNTLERFPKHLLTEILRKKYKFIYRKFM